MIKLPRASAKASGYSSASRHTVAPAQQLISINSVQSSTTPLSSGSTTVKNVTPDNLTSVTTCPTPTVSQSKRRFDPSPTSSLGEMPQKRILTKKGVVSSPTAVNANVKAPPEVLTASRVTRIPIPKGTKIPLASSQQHKQQKTVTVTTTTTTATTSSSSDSPTVASTTSSLADWAIDFQVQLRAMNSRFAAYETRLNEVERLTAENSQLKSALSDAHQLIATLQIEVKRLGGGAPAKNATMSDVSPVASVPATNTNDSANTGVSSYSSIVAGNSSVSKYASLPPTFASKQVKVTHPAPNSATPTPKSNAGFTVVKRKGKSKKPVPPSAAALAAFSRKFSPTSDLSSSSNGYRYVYYKAFKHPLSWYRSKLLPMVGISNSRVIDIHFPTQRVAAFLLHSDFILEFTSTMHQKLKSDPLLDFEPLEDQNLLDPAFASLDSVSRTHKLHDLQNIRVLRALIFVRFSVLVSVAKSMLLQNYIKQAQFDAILADTLAARAAQTPVPTASAADRKEKKRIRVGFLFNLKYLDPISAMTVASAPRPDLPATSDNAHENESLNDAMQDC